LATCTFTPLNLIVGLPPTPLEAKLMCGKIAINVCWSVEFAGSATVVPDPEHAPEVTDFPAVEGTHNDTDAAPAVPAATTPNQTPTAATAAAKRHIQRVPITDPTFRPTPNHDATGQRTNTPQETDRANIGRETPRTRPQTYTQDPTTATRSP
jgi:hypothetical protein